MLELPAKSKNDNLPSFCIFPSKYGVTRTFTDCKRSNSLTQILNLVLVNLFRRFGWQWGRCRFMLNEVKDSVLQLLWSSATEASPIWLHRIIGE